MQGIEKVLWSEQIYNVPASKENILKLLQNIGLKIIKIGIFRIYFSSIMLGCKDCVRRF